MPFQVTVDWKVKDFGPVYREAVAMTAKSVLEKSRQDVAGHLHNSGRFVKGLKTEVKRISGGWVIDVIQKPSFSKVWEFGGVSVGKPFLWIPGGSNKTRLRTYRGKLIKPPGRRVLIAGSSSVKVRGMTTQSSTKKGDVKFIGVASVTHRKRFSLRKIAVEEANKFAAKFSEMFRR